MKHYLKLLLLASISFSITTSRAQAPAWQQSSQWALYNVRGAKFYKVNLDSLNNYNHRPLNDDSIHAFLSHSSTLSSDKPPMWMGAFVTSCILDHKKHKIDISSYGGFFFDETDKKYYTVTQEIQKDWLNYFAESAGSIPAQK
jgi:hypothetical protein